MARVSEIDGYKEATKVLKELDKVTQKKVVLSILRKASRPIINSAKAKVAGITNTNRAFCKLNFHIILFKCPCSP